MAKQIFTPLSNTEIASFCSQMSMILKSGISSIEGVSIMLEDAQSGDETGLLETIHSTLISTGSFHQALEETAVFPPYLLQMVQIGEQTGKLDDVMESLAVYYEKEASIAQMIKNAVTYPLIMIVMMLLVIFVLITKVMPVFNQVFAQLGREMTGISRGILDIGNVLNRYSVVLIVILAVLVLLALYFARTRGGHAAFRSFAAKFKGTRVLSEKIAAFRFANGMALTLSSGLTPDSCLELAAGLVEHEGFQKKLSACREKVESGQDLSQALASCGVFSGIYARMAAIGTKTGIMDEVMFKIAGQYEEEVDTRISGLVAVVEPTLVIILSVIVGIILLSVMLPLIGIMSGL